MTKSRLAKTDGLGPREKNKIRTALRLVWHRSYARALVVKRSVRPDGFCFCEKCKKKCPRVQIDHVIPVGEVDEGFIKRLFCPSTALRALCKECHKERTRVDRISKMEF
jgi:hypothetical protein